MCGGGGGGGNNAAVEESNKLAREQQEREEARRQEIQDNIQKINFFFDGSGGLPPTRFDQKGFDKATEEFNKKFGQPVPAARPPQSDQDFFELMTPQEFQKFKRNEDEGFDRQLLIKRFNDQQRDLEQTKGRTRPKREDFTTRIDLPARGADPNAAFARVREDTFNLFLPELNQQRDDARRASKFQLARQGLLGGRAQIDNKAEITDRFNRGVNDISQRAIAAENEARAARQRTKAGLIARAQAGEDITGLLADAQNSLASAIAQGKSSQAGRPLGSFFDNAASLFSEIAPKLNFGGGGKFSGRGFQQDEENSTGAGNEQVFSINS